MVFMGVKKLDEKAIAPKYAHTGDAGMDIFSNEDCVLKSGERRIVKTGIASSFPEGYVVLVWDRSGNAAKKGIKTMAGVIDSGYRGEWGVVLLNTSNEDFEIKHGDRIAQGLLQPVISAEIKEVENLDDTARGSGAFGSTGKR
jgi:dUTP pyrophosphatase